MELLKLLSTSQIVAQLIGFLILLAVLKVFLWKPFLKLLDDRASRIAEGYKNLEDLKSEVAGLKKDYESRLEDIGNIARAKSDEAIAEGTRIAGAIKDNAKLESQKMIDNANAMIKAEMSTAKEELKEEIVDLAINAAEKVIQEKLTTEEDRKIVMEFLEGIDKVK